MLLLPLAHGWQHIAHSRYGRGLTLLLSGCERLGLIATRADHNPHHVRERPRDRLSELQLERDFLAAVGHTHGSRVGQRCQQHSSQPITEAVRCAGADGGCDLGGGMAGAVGVLRRARERSVGMSLALLVEHKTICDTGYRT